MRHKTLSLWAFLSFISNGPRDAKTSLRAYADRMPRSACASAQSDQGLHCPLTESFDTTEQWRTKAQMRPCACAGWCESAYFAHAQRYFFAWRGPDGCSQSLFVFVTICLCHNVSQLGRPLWNVTSGHMRIAKVQIRLRFRAVWSGPSLSAYKTLGYCRINRRTENRALHCSVAYIFWSFVTIEPIQWISKKSFEGQRLGLIG